MDTKRLKEQADTLFGERTTYMSLLQEIAENFYPHRANFTYQRSFGQEYAGHLMTSYPVMICRDLGNQFGAMLRPREKEWFHLGLADPDEKLDTDAKAYLEWVARGMRKAMYDKRSQFSRATKEGDFDFAAFGQCVISNTLSRHADHLLYRNWHLRDCVWKENEDGGIGFFTRRWKATIHDLVRMFPVHENVRNRKDKTPFEEIEVYHIVCEADFYDEKTTFPYWSIYYDCENNHIMEAVPLPIFEYIVPRWATVSGSQYAFSPATITALPDARLIQAIAMTLLEAGEKAANPPLIAVADVVKSDIGLYAGGLTTVDRDYDERLGAALRPLNQDFRGLPYGFDMQEDHRAILNRAFYLDRLSLPVNAPEMTAYEVGQRVSEYIRDAMPIFEPMEINYNGELCETTMRRMYMAGVFGNPRDNMPRSLRGKETQFHFESPLHDAIERQKGAQFMEGKALIAEAMDLDRTSSAIFDAKVALRESLAGVGIPQSWMRSEYVVNQIEKQEQEKEAIQQDLDVMEQNANIMQKQAVNA